jgi:hypothetical protein
MNAKDALDFALSKIINDPTIDPAFRRGVAASPMLDDFFAALVRAQCFRMARKAAEANRQTGLKGPDDHERPN